MLSQDAINSLRIQTPASVREKLTQKAIAYKKTTDKYQSRVNSIEDAVFRLANLCASRGLEFYTTGMRAASRKAVKSTKYRIECRFGTGELVPTIVFRDSMNGESCTFIDFGVFRKVCENGLHVATSQELIFKQNHLNEWKMDDKQIVCLFEQAFAVHATLVNKYAGLAIEGLSPIHGRNTIIKALADKGIITISQASSATKYSMYSYDARGDLFGIVNSVQEALTTNRNGVKKQTMANEKLNISLLPAIEKVILDTWNIQVAA